ncbi:polyhydroxyalkanoate synthesis repressor [Oryzomicrobium terrae]|uniref:Polyhydroxyalkanoate synthesis repressor n=1 Tax=Oryzomicrobium terrae TaxID=1735038 RepID=A0A5C1E769_9RHOO|nr:polyhydroxyalkanoate synthesis repressor PhaR [Oryzomicrobium terrae]QEL64703.1 polyhydroxyalkanoate synthesis repressor [Oryzomicrobium terrae]
MSDQTRLIKKYPNRRLYDTKTSAYITLADVKDLVLRFEEFKVVDAKAGDDLTRSILLQIILEEETGGVPIFSTELLAQMIRFYGNSMQAMLSKYLETNMKAFVDFQGKVQEQSRSMYGDNNQMQSDMWAQFLNFQGPAMQSMMSAYMDQSKKMFHQMQAQIESQTRNMFTGGFPFPGTPGASGAPAAGNTPGNKPDGKKTEKAG